MKRISIFLLLGGISLLINQGCTSKKFLQPNDKFYTGATVKVKLRDCESGEQGVAKSLAEEQLTPEPNEVIFGMRPSVWMYMQADTSKRKGLGQWLKKKFGREPVLYNDKIPSRTKNLIENRLFNKGFFNAKVKYKVSHKKKEVSVRYQVFPGSRHYIDSIFVQEGKDSIFSYMMKYTKNSLIKKGDPYDLDILKNERVRVTKEVKNQGFYYFKDDYIGFMVDTTRGHEKLITGLVIKKTVPKRSKTPYTIGSVHVYPNYELKEDTSKVLAQTISIDGVYYINPDGDISYEFLNESIHIRPGDTYTSTFHDLTIRRISALNTYKFIDLRFIKSDSVDNELNVVLYLTPLLPQSIRLEIGASSKSNNFVGPGIDVTYTNKNVFRGAELLNIGIGGAFETQIGKNSQGVNSTEFSITSNLVIPKLWGPIQFRVSSKSDLPKTEIDINYTLLDRTLFYRLHSVQMGYGYRWIENQKRQHKLNLLDVNYTRASEVSETFDAFLRENPELRTTFNEQFIFATSYNLWYNRKETNAKKSYWYLNPGIEVAGNAINTINNLVDPEEKKPKEVFGVVYSQFVKLDLDVRYFLSVGREKKIAWRFLSGVGVAYGNSSSLPYLKQYFSGGSTSIRAFQARSIGPGTYQGNLQNGLLIDQSGDIKLESSVEYRTQLYRFIRGAIFVDAGNIWLLNPNEQQPGGAFYFDRFLSQMAVGTGVGLRLDFNFFVLRGDLAFPIRTPAIIGDRWLIDDIDVGSKVWRRDNLVLNIAIGYPF